jgi:AAA+ ATPase superfamily predicted ATPase
MDGFMKNPFKTGGVVQPDELINRKDEIRRITGKISHHGQSYALIGEPRSGKTSLLNYIMSLEKRSLLYGDDHQLLSFQYMDAQTFSSNFTQIQFWEYALRPLVEKIRTNTETNSLFENYLICKENQFAVFALEEFLGELQKKRLHHILIIDEFDTLLDHKLLNQADFYGSLRTLASRFGPALTLAIASRQPLKTLNRRTQQINPTGSPYFNIFDEITLGPFEYQQANEIINLAGKRFTSAEKKIILQIAGGHPFLLQVASSTLWDVYESKKDPLQRLEMVGKQLFASAESSFQDMWRLWSAEMKEAFVIIALDQVPQMLNERDFDLNLLIASLSNYAQELRMLEQRGIIAKDDVSLSRWQITGQVMLWWIAEVLITALRENDNLGQFLRKQEWDGLLKIGEKNQFITAVKGLGGMLKGGVEVFVKTAAEGFGKGISSIK